MTHLTQEVVAFPRPLTDSGKHGESVVFLGDIVDEFLDENRLADACAPEKTDFAALQIRLEQVYHLDAREENFL